MVLLHYKVIFHGKDDELENYPDLKFLEDFVTNCLLLELFLF